MMLLILAILASVSSTIFSFLVLLALMSGMPNDRATVPGMVMLACWGFTALLWFGWGFGW